MKCFESSMHLSKTSECVEGCHTWTDFCIKCPLILPVFRAEYMQLLLVSCPGAVTVMMKTGLCLRVHTRSTRKKVRATLCEGSAIDVRLGLGPNNGSGGNTKLPSFKRPYTHLGSHNGDCCPHQVGRKKFRQIFRPSTTGMVS